MCLVRHNRPVCNLTSIVRLDVTYPSVERNPATLPSANRETTSPMCRKLVAPKISPIPTNLSMLTANLDLYRRGRAIVTHDFLFVRAKQEEEPLSQSISLSSSSSLGYSPEASTTCLETGTNYRRQRRQIISSLLSENSPDVFTFFTSAICLYKTPDSFLLFSLR